MSFNPQIRAEQVRNLATCTFVARHESVLLCGPVGVGKTHCAQSLGHASCRAEYSVLLTKTSACSATSPAVAPTAAGNRVCGDTCNPTWSYPGLVDDQ